MNKYTLFSYALCGLSTVYFYYTSFIAPAEFLEGESLLNAIKNDTNSVAFLLITIVTISLAFIPVGLTWLCHRHIKPANKRYLLAYMTSTVPPVLFTAASFVALLWLHHLADQKLGDLVNGI